MNTESSGMGGEPPTEQPARTIDWREAVNRLSELRPGDVITGFTGDQTHLPADELDIFALNLGEYCKQKVPFKPNFQPLKDNKTRKQGTIFRGWHDGSHLPSQALEDQKKPLLGKIESIRVVMLDDEHDPNNPERIWKRFVVSANIPATGKGIVANITNMMRIGVTHPPKSTLATQLITASYKPRKEKSTQEIIDDVVAFSRTTAEGVVRNGLKHVLPGSFESGKR